MKALVERWLLWSRGSAKIVEEGGTDSDLIVVHVRAGLGLF